MDCPKKSANNCKSPDCYWSYGSCKRDYTKSSSTSSSSNKGKFTTGTYFPGMASRPGKFLKIRKPSPYRKSRYPPIKKCKSNCNCANCNQEKERQERRDANKERERQPRKSPRKSHKKSPNRKNH